MRSTSKDGKRKKESTGCDGDDLHFRHFKAACSQRTLASFDHSIRLLPLLYGFPPKAWEKATDLMILKKANVFVMQKMRTICLLNSELI